MSASIAIETGANAIAANKADSDDPVTSVNPVFLNTEVNAAQVPSTALYGYDSEVGIFNN